MNPSSEVELTPELITAIRTARGKSTAEFAETLDTSQRTVQKWEAGDATPNAASRAAIVATVPDRINIENLSSAIGEGVLWNRSVPPAERQMYGSDRLQLLREQPVTASELDDGLTTFTTQERVFIDRLEVSSVRGGTKRTGNVESVYYLPGDERRAVRRFIDVNEPFVASALSTRNNKLAAEWDEFLYSLVHDEWRFRICRDDD